MNHQQQQQKQYNSSIDNYHHHQLQPNSKTDYVNIQRSSSSPQFQSQSTEQHLEHNDNQKNLSQNQHSLNSPLQQSQPNHKNQDEVYDSDHYNGSRPQGQIEEDQIRDQSEIGTEENQQKLLTQQDQLRQIIGKTTFQINAMTLKLFSQTMQRYNQQMGIKYEQKIKKSVFEGDHWMKLHQKYKENNNQQQNKLENNKKEGEIKLNKKQQQCSQQTINKVYLSKKDDSHFDLNMQQERLRKFQQKLQQYQQIYDNQWIF